MISEEIKCLTLKLKSALESMRHEEMEVANEACEVFFRAHFPLKVGEYKQSEIEQILEQMKMLSDLYISLIANVEEEKINITNKLMSLGRNKVNTNRYLDIAKHF